MFLDKCRASGARGYLGIHTQPLRAGLSSGTPPALWTWKEERCATRETKFREHSLGATFLREEKKSDAMRCDMGVICGDKLFTYFWGIFWNAVMGDPSNYLCDVLRMIVETALDPA